jgi:hypothetical protein
MLIYQNLGWSRSRFRSSPHFIEMIGICELKQFQVLLKMVFRVSEKPFKKLVSIHSKRSNFKPKGLRCELTPHRHSLALQP